MKKLEIDREVLQETSNLQLVSTLTMLAPFNKIDDGGIIIVQMSKFPAPLVSNILKYKK